MAGLTAAMLSGAIQPAMAKPLEREHFRESFSEVVEGFCGTLTVRIDTEVHGAFLINPHGRDGLAYGSQNVHGTDVVTNLANGKALTSTFNVVEKELKVTDNGDGTLTVLVLSTGSFKIYDLKGKFLFTNPGQIRFEVLVDHGGTPTDPADDELLDFLGLTKGSTGRNDTQGLDPCEDIYRPLIG